MAVELAVGYVSLVTDASRIPRQIEDALNSAGRNADRHGTTIGNKLASGLSTALKAGVVGAAATVSGVIGAALTKGIGRLTAIDDAQGKLRGLGHDAASVKEIMADALASVKGTAFGLGEAASTAAGAVAAGIKPGQELTDHLKRVADAATIAGTGISEMGSIFNKVATSNKIQGDVIDQLSDAGIPIVALLAKELHTTAEEVVDLASKGKINFAQFSSAMQNGLGGAALASGTTVRGALANVEAALGRLGASALGPVFKRLSGWFGELITRIDQATTKIGPLAEKLDQQIFSKIVPQVSKMWSAFSSSGAPQALAGAIQQVMSVLTSLASSAKAAGPSVLTIAKSLGQAAGFIGVAAWQVLLKVLQATAQIIDSVLVPALSTIAGLMSSNQHTVTALAAAWLAFKTIPRLMQSVGTAMTGVQTRTVAAAGSLNSIVTANGRVVETARNGSVVMGRFGSSIATIGTSVPVIARMQSAFVDAATGASRFGRTAGTAAALTTGLKSATSGLIGALGGPWGLAITAGVTALVMSSASAQSAKAAQRALADAVAAGATAQSDFAKAVSEANGALSSQAVTAGSASVKASLAEITTLGERGHTAWQKFVHGFDAVGRFGAAKDEDYQAAYKRETQLADSYEALHTVMGQLQIDMDGLGTIVTKGGAPFNDLIARLRETGSAGGEVADILVKTNQQLNATRDIASNATPGFFTLTAAIKTLADESSTASERLDAMKTALDTLAGVPVSAQDALAKYNEQVRATAQVATEFDPSKGIGTALIDNGKIDTATANGKLLYDTLKNIRDVTLENASAGNDLAPTLAKNDTQFQQLADAAGLSKEQIIALAASIGYLPGTIEILAKLKGATEVEQKLAVISELMKTNSGGVEIPVKDLGGDAVIAKLKEAGVQIDDVNGKPGIVKLSAPDAQAVLDKLNEIVHKDLPSKTQTITIDYKEGSLPVSALKGIHEIPAELRADGGIDGALPGQAVIQSPRANLIQWAEPETGGEAFIPLASSKRSRSTGILAQVAEMFGYRLSSFASGGITTSKVPQGVTNALTAAKKVSGSPYKWGGTGPSEFDCSGLVGYIQQTLMGIADATTRLYTTSTLMAGPVAGLKSGFGPSGTYFQIGVNAQHMAATLSGQPLEAGGSHGDARLGSPAVGATDSQFTVHFYLPNNLIDGISSESTSKSTSKSSSKTQEWTENDELKLQGAELDVTDAKTARDKVYSDSTSSDTDKKRADLKVKQAQQDLLDLQEQKDGVGTSTDDSYVPAAPALSKSMTDDEITLQSAILDRDEADEKRNAVYADSESTDRDKARADLSLQTAQNALSKAQKTDWSNSFAGKSWDLAKSTAFGLLGAFASGISEMLPFGFGDLFKITVNTPSDDDLASRGVSASLKIGDFSFGTLSTGSFSAEEISKQLPITIPSGEDVQKALEPYINQAPASILDWLQPKAKVFDQGGWLEPGGTAVNLSNKPEPIFSSPQQLREFTSTSSLTEPATTNGGGDTLNVTNNGMDPNSAARAVERVVRRKTLASQIKGGFGRA